MAKKPLHDKVLANSVDMLALYEKQMKLTREMMRVYECRIATLSEFIRANITGDEQGFKILAPIVGKGTGTTRPFYNNGLSDDVRTKKAVQLAQQWRESSMSKKVKPTPCPHCKTEHFLTKHGKFPPHQCRPGQRCPMSSQRAAQ